MRSLGLIIALVITLLVLGALMLFTVDQREHAIVFRLGKVQRVVTEPGLKFKAPLIDTVRRFDNRIQTIDFQETDRVLTCEKINVIVDSFVKWKVAEPVKYYVSVGGDPAQAANRLMRTVNNRIRDEFAKHTVATVVSGKFELCKPDEGSQAASVAPAAVPADPAVTVPTPAEPGIAPVKEGERNVRTEIMKILREDADEDGAKIGVDVLDVRIKRVELPQDASEPVYKRMRAERQRVAADFRSRGAADSETIRAAADSKREVTIANAYSEAQKLMGDGDAKASAIYAQAFSKNPEFYAFYRSLESYLKSFKDKQNVLLLDPNSDFFKYLKNPNPPGK
jgi:modulator of FtsH protease HflC